MQVADSQRTARYSVQAMHWSAGRRQSLTIDIALMTNAGLNTVASGALGIGDLHFVLAVSPCCLDYSVAKDRGHTGRKPPVLGALGMRWPEQSRSFAAQRDNLAHVLAPYSHVSGKSCRA